MSVIFTKEQIEEIEAVVKRVMKSQEKDHYPITISIETKSADTTDLMKKINEQLKRRSALR